MKHEFERWELNLIQQIPNLKKTIQAFRKKTGCSVEEAECFVLGQLRCIRDKSETIGFYMSNHVLEHPKNTLGFSVNGKRVEARLSREDWNKVGRGYGWQAVLTDQNTGKVYSVKSALCDLPTCFCRAEGKEIVKD